MLKQVILLTVALFIGLAAFAQSANQYAKVSDSDPKAKAIMDQVRKKYDAYKSLEADFVLSIELPEQPKETQKGKIARQGQQYSMQMGSHEAFSDGKALYMVMHNNKEVQINDLPAPGEDESLLSPQAILNFYDKDNFVLLLVDERTESGSVVQYIEMKPTKRSSEYSKMRVAIDKQTKQVRSIKAFAKDGSRYTFTLTNLKANPSLPASRFVFNKSKFAGYHVEDLRS